MSVLLAIALFSQAKSLISVDFAPMPVRKALTVLSQATGKELKASDAFIDEVLFAHFKDVPVDEAFHRIGDALLARWDHRPDGSVWLLPDAKARQKAADAEAAKERAKLQASLDYVRRTLEKQPEEMGHESILKYLMRKAADDQRRKAAEAANDYDRVFAEPESAEESPAWRALARIVLAMDPKQLLGMPNDDIEVWAENPTSMQHAFPEGTGPVLATYRREEAELDSTLITSRIKVTMTKWESGSAMSGNIEVLDPNGKVVDKAFVRLNNDSELMKIPFSARPKAAAKPGELPIVLPSAVMEFRNALSDDYKGKDRDELLKKYRQRMLNPEIYEPTEFYRGEDLIVAGKQSGKNVVGCVNDLIDASYSKAEKATPSQIFQKGDVQLCPAPEGWVVARPAEDLFRGSRRKAEVVLKESERLGGISVDMASAWVCQTEKRWPFVGWLGDYLRTLFSGRGPYSTISTTIDDTSLRLWGAIPPGDMDSLKRGSKVNLAALPIEFQTQIHRMVFWHRALDNNDIDPTDKLPNGITGGNMSLETVETPVFYAWNSTNKPAGNMMPLDAKMMGKGLAVGSHYWSIEPAVFQHYDRFRMGVNRKYMLHISINPGALPMTVNLSETFFPPESGELDHLPDAVQKEVEEARKQEAAKPKEADDKAVIPPA